MTYNVIIMVQSKTTTRLISRNVIKALAFAGATTTALVVPNSTILIERIMDRLDKKDAQRTLTYLKYRKLIEVKVKDGQFFYKLTAKGADRFEKIMIEELAISTPRKWDKKWRLVLFDIPVYHRRSRDQLIEKLRNLNFYMLQRSAWIHPFSCEKQIGVLLKTLNLEKHVSYVVVDQTNFNDHAIEYFKKSGLLI